MECFVFKNIFFIFYRRCFDKLPKKGKLEEILKIPFTRKSCKIKIFKVRETCGGCSRTTVENKGNGRTRKVQTGRYEEAQLFVARRKKKRRRRKLSTE